VVVPAGENPVRWTTGALALIALVGLAGTTRAVELGGVYHEPSLFDPAKGEEVRVHFHLSERARVELRLYDARDLLVATVKSPTPLDAGDRNLAWKGRDSKGRLVPPEAYTYTLGATGPRGEKATWDITESSAPKGMLSIPAPSWDRVSQRVSYAVSAPARVRIRIGLANNGPLMRTLLDWVVRTKGDYEVPWDGWDASSVVDLSEHPNLAFDALAFGLPRNTLVVGPPSQEVRLIEDLDGQARPRAAVEAPRRMLDFPRQRIESRHDFPVEIQLPASLPRAADGLPLVTDSIPVQLGLSTRQEALVQDERFEVVFYVDGHHAFETEVGFFPVTWTWNPRGENEGKHYITVNLRGYEGHFGISTVLVRVARPATEGAGGG
jgi:hypothetical protein